tara:strand:- start:2000 stop:3082 length:1083 start_codon:yes stop_codon:yes gene_type:complete
MNNLICFLSTVFSFLTIHSQTDNYIKNILEEFNYSTDSFFVGGTINKFQLDTEIEKTFLKEFSYLTPANSFKQTVIHPKPDVWRWDRHNNFINFANENNLTLRVHGPISPQASKWVKDDVRTKEELTLILEEYFTELCKKVNKEPSVRWMDVVNETVLRNGSWFAEKPGTDKWENPWTQIGINDDGFPKYIVKAFEIANKNATNIKLVYNHNGGMEKVMWEKIMETITYLKSKGLRVDAIGWQAHLRTNSLSNEDLKYLDFLMDWAHENNLEFHITELNLWVKEEIQNLDSIQNIQAELYQKIIDKMISKNNNGVVALNFWGIKDRKRPNKLNKNILSIYDPSLHSNPALNIIKTSLKSK